MIYFVFHGEIQKMPSFFTTRILDLNQEQQKELSDLVLKILKMDPVMDIIIPAYIDCHIQTIKDGASIYKPESTGFDMFFALLKMGKDLERKLVHENGVTIESAHEIANAIKEGDIY